MAAPNEQKTPKSGLAARLGRLVDGVVGVFSPGAALRRAAQRSLLTSLSVYQAAARDRHVHNWRDRATSADSAGLTDRIALTNRAREGERDDWTVNSIAGAYVRNAPGVGITTVAASPSQSFNAKWNKLWRQWARRHDVVDVEGKKTLNAILRLGEKELVLSGNSFLIWSFERRSDTVGLRFQMFEVEQLAVDEAQFDNLAPGHEVRHGVELDRHRRPVAYWVYLDQHPLDSTYGIPGRAREEKPTRVPAERVLHLHQQSRVMETLGITRLKSILRKTWMQKNYDDNEQIAKAMEAMLAFAIVTNPAYGGNQQIGLNAMSGDVAGPNGTDTQDADGNLQLNFQAGMAPILKPGQDIKMFNPSRPGLMYGEYTDRQTAMTAAGAGLSYAAVSRDLSKANFSSLKQGGIEDNKAYDIDQQDIVDLWLRPITRLFTRFAILDGWLDADEAINEDGSIHEDWMECKFQPPTRQPIDEAKAAAAAKINRDYLIDTLEEQCSAEQKNWRDQIDKFAEIRDYAKKKGIDLPEFVITNPPVSPSEPRPVRGNQTPGSQSAEIDAHLLSMAFRDTD